LREREAPASPGKSSSRRAFIRTVAAGPVGGVNWYEQQGFTRTDRYERRGFVGQIFSMPVAPSRPGRPDPEK
jgi:hypothetical protein